jgi:mono/diheme cytochrome c family protein
VLKGLVTVVQVITLGAVVATVFLLLTFTPTSPSREAAANLGILGEQVWVRSCAGCHGADGEGGIGPTLAGGAVVEEFPDRAEQITLVTEGLGGMPAFGGRLTPGEIGAVVDYTRNELAQQ